MSDDRQGDIPERGRVAGLVRDSLLMDGAWSTCVELPCGRVYLGPGADYAPDAASVVAIGAFDGMHLGHRSLVSAASKDAKARGVRCLAVTFDPDPSEVVSPSCAEPQLLGVPDRVRALLAVGVDGVVVLRFSEDLAARSPESFLEGTLGPIMRVVGVHVGSDFRFGHLGAGTVETLAKIGARRGFDVCAHELVVRDGEVVSSSRIRAALARPDGVGRANELLGRWHFVRGTIVRGRGEGTSFGFPTANVQCVPRACMPAEGVYGGFVRIGDEVWPAAINVGAPVSFSGPRERFLEANLIGFSGDVYGSAASVAFARWLRGSRRFSSIEELEETVLSNIAWVRDHLGGGAVGVAT